MNAMRLWKINLIALLFFLVFLIYLRCWIPYIECGRLYVSLIASHLDVSWAALNGGHTWTIWQDKKGFTDPVPYLCMPFGWWSKRTPSTGWIVQIPWWVFLAVSQLGVFLAYLRRRKKQGKGFPVIVETKNGSAGKS
jgi:hypothetical protein